MATKKEEIARRIKERREYLDRIYGGYKQEDVARKIGMSRVGYNHYENARSDITMPVVMRIAEVLGIPVSEIAGEESTEHSIRFENEHLLTEEQKRTVHQIAESAAIAAADAYIRAVKPRRTQELNNDEGEGGEM